METSPSTKCFQLDLFLEEKTVNKIFLNIARARIDSGSQKASREFKKHFFKNEIGQYPQVPLGYI